MTRRRSRRSPEIERAYLEQLFEGASDGMALVDPDGRVLRVNRQLAAALRYGAGEMRGLPLAAAVTLPGAGAVEGEAECRCKDGSLLYGSVRASPVALPRGRTGTSLVFGELKAERSPGRALRGSGRYALVARGANDGLWDWNLESNEIQYSHRWKTLLGYQDDEIGTGPDEWFSRVHPDDLAALRAAIAEHVEGCTEHFHNEHRLRHKSGRYLWGTSRGVAGRDAAGRPYLLAGSFADITDRKAAEERLLHETLHDGLTGLPNRTLFLKVLQRVMRNRLRQPGYLFAVLFLDLDRFKVVNDGVGHVLGDQMLLAIAARLHTCVRPGDTVARHGGDEFLVLLDDVRSAADAVRVADRIQKAMTAPFALEGQEVFTSASMGIIVGADEHDQPEHVLRDAHTAAQRAKDRGRARYEVFDPAMHARAEALLRLETDLRRAVEREEFRLHYQPVVSLKNRRVTGFEALVRWSHPERGLVSPAEFIPVAEETGLIVPLGWWVLREASRQLRAWRDRFPQLDDLSISVNVSPRQFLQPDLVERVADAVQAAGVPPAALKLEITEGVLMGDPDSAYLLIDRLRTTGVRVDIDDFGTGYSSLSYLHRLPVDGLKIDRSFIAELDVRRGSSEIVKTIVTLGEALGLQVIAEGVETEEQASRLSSLGCGHAQGYLFQKPVDAGAADRVLAQRFSLEIEPVR
ncbi:MAG: EAL domain-containing protein [Gemmatimonadetes bacterium]|nr:EAL domain-containing protein [Gemmatimonadota bacterium]